MNEFNMLNGETLQEYDIRIAKIIGYDLSIQKTPEIAKRNNERILELIKLQKELNLQLEKEIEEVRKKYNSLLDPVKGEKNFLLRGRI